MFMLLEDQKLFSWEEWSRWLPVTTLIKNPCKKYKTKVMGHIFESEWWEKHPSGCSFWLLWLKEIGKGFGKAWGINWHFIYEKYGKYKKREVKGHKFHVRRKMKENNGNEENRDLIDKMAYED